MRNVLFFDDMLTPKLITLIYWLGVIGVVVTSVTYMFSQNFLAGLGMLIMGVIAVRVWCELIIVIFKINENLKVVAGIEKETHRGL